MNILPYQIHSLLKICHNPVHASPAVDRTALPRLGRKEQIKRKILEDILKKIR